MLFFSVTIKGSSMDKEMMTLTGTDSSGRRVPPNYLYNTGSEQGIGGSDHDQRSHNRNHATEDQLGPLPPNWEKAYTDSEEVYFIELVLNFSIQSSIYRNTINVLYKFNYQQTK